MKIAYSATIFKVQNEGGISRYFYQLISGVLRQGHKVYLGNNAPNGKYIDALRDTPVQFEVFNPTLIEKIRLDERLPLGSIPKDLSTWSPDIIHETFYSPKWFREAQNSTKKVLTVYDLIDEKSANPRTFKSRKLAALKLADHVICISQATQNDLIDYYDFPIEKTSVIYLAPFPNPNIDTNSSAAEEIGGAPFFLYVGAREGYKNFQTVLEAFALSQKQHPDIKLVAFGGGPCSAEERIKLQRLSLEGKVEFKSGSDSELYANYRSTLALIYPSIWEGFGMPPLEAMTMGTPVIVSENPCSVEIFSRKTALFFDPQSPQSLMNQMEFVISSSFNLSEFRQQAKALVEQYTWEKCITETLRLYDSLNSK